MKSYLDKAKIDYFLYHLSLRMELSHNMKELFVFLKDGDVDKIPENKIVFLLSAKEYCLGKVINEIPVLYPILDIRRHTTKINNSIVFSHDIIKQIFCFQTLYYEKEIETTDRLGRIRVEDTLNFKLKIVDKPLVDYLYEVIINAIRSRIEVKRRRLFSNYGFIFSHDVDRVDSYNFYNTLNSLKQIITNRDRYKWRINNARKHLVEYLKFSARDNPVWDFQEMQDIEDEFGVKSTFYLLNRGELHKDAYYSLEEKKMLKLWQTIKTNKNEMGIHLTIKANTQLELAKQEKANIEEATNHRIIGSRSHWLRYDANETGDILEQIGIKYDTSIGYFAKEGFRSGTCLPYKLFSYKENRMLDVWEYPLIFMECMILDYQDISQEEALVKLAHIIAEVKKFNGIFTFLWHNGNFCNPKPYNRKGFLKDLLKLITTTGSKCITAEELTSKLEGMI